jgi:L-amino acid N-acyltransferase YncA
MAKESGSFEVRRMNFRLDPVSAEDGRQIIDIFNHYVESSFAAYPEKKVPYEFFQLFLNMAQGYPFLAVRNDAGEIIGFGLLHPHNPIPAFSRTAEITYFIAPEYTGKGIGKAMLDCLLDAARKKGITSILASISSQNPGSLAFHRKNKFAECGRFVGIGKKGGRDFDVIWMQRIIG